MANTNQQADNANMQQQHIEVDKRIPDPAIPYYKLCRKLTLNLNKAQHHHTYLQQCIESNITPKGLQTRVPPQIPDQKSTFTIKWEQAHLEFSQNLTKILSKYYQERIEEIRLELETNKKTLQTKCNTSQFDHINNIIHEQEATQLQTLQNRRTKKTEGPNIIPPRKKRPAITGPTPSTSRTNLFRQ